MIQTVICVIWSYKSWSFPPWHLLSLRFPLHFFWHIVFAKWRQEEQRTMAICICAHFHLYIVRVVVYKLAAWFPGILNSNSWMRTFKHPIHLKIKPLIWIAKYNFRPSILIYSHSFLSAPEREWYDHVLAYTEQHEWCPHGSRSVQKLAWLLQNAEKR